MLNPLINFKCNSLGQRAIMTGMELRQGNIVKYLVPILIYLMNLHDLEITEFIVDIIFAI